ncbi:hypothetical protein [Burkholderia multivorans]|uniref:hypothetical protein n=1 Tax=Burkholderia multivorans TaxID=87883 RepID=UPI0011B1F6EA|nr:hypothetical protein [Burkholderia multivorans]
MMSNGRRTGSIRVYPRRLGIRDSIKTEAKALAEQEGITREEAEERVLAQRRAEAQRIADEAKSRRAGRQHVDPVEVTRGEAERLERLLEAQRAEDARRRREDEKRISTLTDLVVSRGTAFGAFVVIIASKGLPAHIIDERKLSSIVVERRWDLVPPVLAWLIREDDEVKQAFDVFSDAANKCMENLRTGSNKANKRANEIISEKYRDMYLHAASAYARKLSTLESSLDRLTVLTLDELEVLVADGDDLSKRIASISVKISEEIKRREAKKGSAAKDERLKRTYPEFRV